MGTDTIGGRVAYMLSLIGISGRELARRAGISQSIVSKIVNDEQDSTRYLPELAEVLGCRLAWLARGVGSVTDVSDSDKVAADSASSDRYVMLHRWLDPRCMLGPRYGDSSAQEMAPIEVPRSVFDRQTIDLSQTFGDVSPDDAMADGISVGDELAISTSQRDARVHPPGSVFAIRSGDRLRYRAITHTALDDVVLIATHPDKRRYPDETYSAEDAQKIEIVGRVFWRGGDK